MRQSLRAGRIVSIEVPRTICDGQQTQAVGQHTVRGDPARWSSDVLTVPDPVVVEAMRFAFERLKVVLEPSGACALAALMHHRERFRGRRVGVTLSGGNVGADRFVGAAHRRRAGRLIGVGPQYRRRRHPRAAWLMLLVLIGGFALSQAFRTVGRHPGAAAAAGVRPDAAAAGPVRRRLPLRLRRAAAVHGHGHRRLRPAPHRAGGVSAHHRGALVAASADGYARLIVGQVLIGIGCAPAFLVCTVFIARRFPAGASPPSTARRWASARSACC